MNAQDKIEREGIHAASIAIRLQAYKRSAEALIQF